MTTAFLKSLVADMRANGETEAYIDDGGTTVPITFVPAPIPRRSHARNILDRFRLLDHANAQRPFERN